MPVGRNGGDNRSKQSRAEAHERAEQALRLRTRGATYRGAGEAVGLSESACRRAILRILKSAARNRADLQQPRSRAGSIYASEDMRPRAGRACGLDPHRLEEPLGDCAAKVIVS